MREMAAHEIRITKPPTASHSSACIDARPRSTRGAMGVRALDELAEPPGSERSPSTLMTSAWWMTRSMRDGTVIGFARRVEARVWTTVQSVLISARMSEFKPGDVVQLKSGGPKMTISEASPGLRAGHWNCVWFNHEGETKAATFQSEALKKADEV
jgi:uncharacterized protein YodC (DUF2158 family)